MNFLSTGGQAEAGGAHAKREAHPASNLIPLPGQPRVPLQGKLPSREQKDLFAKGKRLKTQNLPQHQLCVKLTKIVNCKMR